MKPVRIGMWSGPRNLSTAMMRSFGSRADTAVADEPFYAHFLKTTRENHPGRDEVFRHHESDWRRVAEYLTGPVPGDKPVWYQKLLTHHIVGEMDLAWTEQLVNCFLIRHPRDVILSYQRIYPKIDVDLLGYRQQLELFDLVTRRSGHTPLVIEADDIAADPETTLTRLCDGIGIGFTVAMLSWHAGPHPSDGVWARYWYENVMKTTTFHPLQAKTESIDRQHYRVYEQCMECYEKLHPYRLL